MYSKNPILDIRYSTIAGGEPVLEILRGAPVYDERSGAVIGFRVDGTWEGVCTVRFANHESYRADSESVLHFGRDGVSENKNDDP